MQGESLSANKLAPRVKIFKLKIKIKINQKQ